MNANKLKAKELVTIAVFGVVFILVYMACALPTGMLVPLYPFCVGVAMIPCGIVWAYLRAKTPKPFAILIQGVLFAVFTFIMGSGWFVALGILAGCVLAELLARVGKYRSFRWNVAGYAAFAVCLNLGLFAIILLARDYYYEFCVASGMTAEYMEALLSFVSVPLLALTSVLSVVGAVIGMLLGKAFLKKHFERAGIA
jgi:energy-coupling factor transport system substrate-specific component